MHSLSIFAQTKLEEEKAIKDIMLMLGFGMGLVTGVALYKYSQSTKKFVDQTEKKIVKEAQKLEKQAEEGMQELETKVKKGMKKAEQKAKKVMQK